MLERFSQMAEQAATNVSRRQFLGRFGRGAMIVAATAGGLLTLPSAAKAARPGRCCCNFSTRDCYRRSRNDPCLLGYEPCKCRAGCV
jgi:hypothetical protein